VEELRVGSLPLEEEADRAAVDDADPFEVEDDLPSGAPRVADDLLELGNLLVGDSPGEEVGDAPGGLGGFLDLQHGPLRDQESCQADGELTNCG
jgi:hypothetical protein